MAKRIFKGIMTLITMVTLFNVGVGRVAAAGNNYINYYGLEITESEYTNLLNLGFTEKEIYYMDRETYVDNKDYEAVLLASNTKYYKTVIPYYGTSYTTEVTLNDYQNYLNGNQPLDFQQTFWNEIMTTISYKNATKYRYKIGVEWLSMPSNFSYDVIGIGFLDDVYINSSLFFKSAWTNSDGTDGQTTGHYDDQSTPYGGTITYALPTNVIGMGATFYFDVSKDTNDTITSLEMCGDYAHSLYQVTGMQASNHVMSYYGIGFNSSVVAYFNEIPCTYAGVYGISW